jgi:hypothetical protein
MKRALLFAMATLWLVGCDDGLRRRLDELERKVDALESQGGPGYVGAFTNLQPSFTSMTQWGVALVDLSPPVTAVRIYARMSQPATTGDLVFQCDTDPTFASATACAQIDDPGVGNVSSDWTPLRGADCTDASAWCRFGMSGGNGAEDPVVRSAGYDLKGVWKDDQLDPTLQGDGCDWCQPDNHDAGICCENGS